MRWLTTILFLFATSVSFAQNPLLRRICQDPNDNTLFWSNPIYSCSTLFQFYIIWASNDNVSFYSVDTNYNTASNIHTHKNANSNPGIPNRYYFIERRDSCGPTYNHSSDTLKIDVDNPPFTFLDSVSVDINTNQVVLGWRRNTLPDFNRYFTYKDNPYISLDPGGLRDTFQIDITGSNPSIRSYEYDINTTDSCGNPSIFGINPHATIHLFNEVDTCLKSVSLKWNPYKGWSIIKKYYIYQDSGTGYFLLDSLPGNINQFTYPIILGTTYQYYIRAFKDTSILVTSSSNKIQFSTRKRIDPAFIRINYISSDHNSQTITLNFSADEAGETKLYKVLTMQNGVLYSTLSYTKNDLSKNINTGLNWSEKFLFTIKAEDYCGLTTLQSDTSTNIVLTKEEDSFNTFKWNPYFTWNTGIEKYLVSRGTGDGNIYTFDFWKETQDTFITDSQDFQNAKANGVCYYITAIKNNSPDTFSNSNILCFPYPFTAFFPSAFVPTGLNNLFRPGGASIDYEKSTFQIYDRWGKLVYSDYIKNGWDGSDQSGDPCMDGLYFYKAEVISIKNEKLIKNGSVTLLR